MDNYEFEKKKRVVVMGDIHGDLRALIYALMKAKVINKKLDWIGKDTYLVQMGDQVDRACRAPEDFQSMKKKVSDEDSDVKIINFMDSLDKEAKKQGGRVISLIGNHELMNSMGNLDYVSERALKNVGGKMARFKQFRPGGEVAKILSKRPALVKIGSWVFVHGGITGDIAKKFSINQINNKLSEFFRGENKDFIHDKDFEKLFLDGNSLLWNREYSDKNPKCGKLKTALKHLKAKYLVMGHTPQINGINAKCGGRAWRVDTGMSEAFGPRKNKYDRIQIMEIINDGDKIRIIHSKNKN